MIAGDHDSFLCSLQLAHFAIPRATRVHWRDFSGMGFNSGGSKDPPFL